MKQRWLMVLGVVVPTAAAALFEGALLVHGSSPTTPQQVVGRVALMAIAATTFSALMLTLVERNRRALREQQRKFDDLFEGSPDGLMLIDGHRRILASNPTAVTLLGYPAQPPLLSLCRLCVLPEGQSCQPDCPLHKNRPDAHFRTTLRTASGKLLAASASLTPLPDQETLLRFSDLTLVESREQAHLSRLLALKALEATEDERRRLARELHDGVGQELYALRLAARAGQPVDDMASALMEEVDKLAKSLWPPVLEKLGLLRALKAAFASHQNVALVAAEDFPRLSPSLEGTLYRIAQEAVANALKHGSPGTVQVKVRQIGAEVVMRVDDDGAGFDELRAEEKLSLGLVGMRERARLVQGVCSITSRPGEGTTVEVQLPLLVPTREGEQR